VHPAGHESFISVVAATAAACGNFRSTIPLLVRERDLSVSRRSILFSPGLHWRLSLFLAGPWRRAPGMLVLAWI